MPQYLLTEPEYQALQRRALATERNREHMPTRKALQDFCTMVANTLPVAAGWHKGKPWECIRTVKHEWYCDDCPAKAVCPYENKNWSK